MTTTTGMATETSPDLDASLSTQPAPVAPPVPSRSPLVPLRRSWRQLTSMRTALLLLFLLALAAVPGSFLPQRPVSPQRVSAYFAKHRALAPLLDRVGGFDVFATPWFAAIYLALFVSLVGCLVPRIRLHAKALRTPPPKVPANLSRLPVADRWEVDATPEEVVDAARRTLKKSRYRVVRRSTARGAELSAEKGYLRETGNLLFHVCLVLLLVGIAWGAMYGFKGTVLVKEGKGFANANFNYDDRKPGRLFHESSLVPLQFTLNDFRATYAPDGKASTFDADVTWSNGADGAARRYDVRVNHPLEVGAAKVYLIGHGYAPEFVVRDPKGRVVLDRSESVVCLPQDAAFTSTCVLKLPDALPRQMAFEGIFTPSTVQDPTTGRVGSNFPAARNPGVTLLAYTGDVGLDSGLATSVYRLDKSRLTLLDPAPHELGLGEVWQLPGGGSIAFVGVKEWATFQVTQDPGKLLALLAGSGMVIGLVLSLFVRRRRVWVRASTLAGGDGRPGRTVVEVGGLARTDTERFAEEFSSLADRMRPEETRA